MSEVARDGVVGRRDMVRPTQGWVTGETPKLGTII